MAKTETNMDNLHTRHREGQWTGHSLERVEDQALLRGEGQFIDDISPGPGALHACFVRSPHPHAVIASIDTARALAIPGVAAVITGADIRRYTKPFVVGVKQPMEHWSLAVDRVRYVGEPVAIICATDRYRAEDAAQVLDIVYDPLPAVIDPLEALESHAAVLHPAVGANLVSDRSFVYGDPEKAFACASRIIDIAIRYPRNAVTPIECMGVIARYIAAEDSYDLTTHFQGPYAIHPVMALALQVPGNRLRIRTPRDSGGSFGTKHAVFTYAVALAIAARVTGRPVKWIEDRLENLSGATSATNRVTTLRAAVDDEGRILALDYDQIDDCGGYLRAPEPATLYRMHGNLTGAYAIQHLRVRNRIVLTNKTPSGLVRGFGGPQVYFALERLTAKIAREMGRLHLEIIEKNLLPADSFPWRTPSGGLLDSGDYQSAIALLRNSGIAADLEERRKQARAEGRIYGIGLAAIVEPSISNMGYITTVLTPQEREKAGPKGGAVATATVGIDPLGGLNVHVASVPQGQGHRTVLQQVVADELGIDPSDINVTTELDTARDAWSIASGNYSSRFAGAVAGAASIAARRLREKLARTAALQLACDESDIRFAGGRIFSGANPAKSAPFKRIAATSHWAQGAMPQGFEPVLRETAFWSPDSLAPPNALEEINSSAAHGFVLDVCGLEVDPSNGRLRIDRYVSIHDAGRILNPALADGQVRGGFANAIGATLMEHFAYSKDGAFQSGTLADYLIPTVHEVPAIEIIHLETPSPFTPLGAKGIAEGNCMSTPVCIANALADALDICDVELPLTPSRVHELLQSVEKPPAQPLRERSGFRTSRAITGEGSHYISMPPEKLWPILLDPVALASVIPGCKSLEQNGANAYCGEIRLGVGVVKGLFAVNVSLSDMDPPRSLVLRGGASGALGESSGEALVRLSPENHGVRISYSYGLDLSGRVAAVGGRMIDGASRLLIAEFFKRLARYAASINSGDQPGQKQKSGIFARWFGGGA